jgi:hypothetical protein
MRCRRNFTGPPKGVSREYPQATPFAGGGTGVEERVGSKVKVADGTLVCVEVWVGSGVLVGFMVAVAVGGVPVKSGVEV